MPVPRRWKVCSTVDMYSVREFGHMISDATRLKAYEKAIARGVRAGDLVAEIGCGPAVFAVLACQAGAKCVYAIETKGIIDAAKQIAAANGFAERIQFYQNAAARRRSCSGVDCGRRGGAIFAGSNGWKGFARGNREKSDRAISGSLFFARGRVPARDGTGAKILAVIYAWSSSQINESRLRQGKRRSGS